MQKFRNISKFSLDLLFFPSPFKLHVLLLKCLNSLKQHHEEHISYMEIVNIYP